MNEKEKGDEEEKKEQKNMTEIRTTLLLTLSAFLHCSEKHHPAMYRLFQMTGLV
jgi:hypothetical protein